MIRAIDICSGAGGWACAARGLPIQIVAAVDMDHDALITYTLNHPGVLAMRADVRHLPFHMHHLRRQLDIDLVLGGIPCETISCYRSVNTERNGKVTDSELAEWHATLDACMEFVDSIQPRWWCFEDVTQITRHLPPLTPYMIYDAAEFSGQRRKRAYVGRFPHISPPMKSPRVLRDYLRPGPYRIGTRALRRKLSTNCTFRADTAYAAYAERKAPTMCNISSRRDSEFVVVEGGRKRQIEWQEGAALQGFPPDYVFYGSPTTVSKHVGQAIQIDVGRAILAAICKEAGLLNAEAIA